MTKERLKEIFKEDEDYNATLAYLAEELQSAFDTINDVDTELVFVSHDYFNGGDRDIIQQVLLSLEFVRDNLIDKLQERGK